jgi:hypothetical protein
MFIPLSYEWTPLDIIWFLLWLIYTDPQVANSILPEHKLYTGNISTYLEIIYPAKELV